MKHKTSGRSTLGVRRSMFDVQGSPHPPIAPSPPLSGAQHFSISSFWLAVNLLWGALLIVVVPAQIRSIDPANWGETTGHLVGFAALCAVVIPLVVGPLSDRCMSRWGRRRPYIAVGVAINVIGLAILWAAGIHLNLALYFVGYVIVQIGNNIATGAYSGVIPDIVPEGQKGEASGWMGAMSQLGTVIGVVSSGVLMNANKPTAAFAIMAVSLVLFAGITLIGVRERPRTDRPETMTALGFVKRLWIDPRKHPDFAWVWITRALVVMGIWTVQMFMQPYLISIAGVPEERAEIAAALVLTISLICATVTGLLGGKLSDRVGRKKVVYVANSAAAVTFIAFLVYPSLAYAAVISAFFGLAYGAYYSVDWALACDVLPNKEDAAKDMAVWHIAMTLPQAVILPISGSLLAAFGSELKNGIAYYKYPGFVAIFSLAAIFLLLGAFFLRNVRGVR